MMPFIRLSPRLGVPAVVSALHLVLTAPGSIEAASLPALQSAALTGRQVDDATLEKLLKLPHSEVEHVRLVVLPANVEDRRGRIVKGLTREDFLLFEDQVPQEIQYFSVEAEEPVEVAFLLDVSGSMRQLAKLEEAKEAIRFFVESLRPQDRFALICFADQQVSWVTEFTSDRERFLARLAVQEGYGQTALNDAVAAAPRLVEESVEGKKAIVLITDAIDNASALSTREALRLARQVQVPIYAIGFSAVPETLVREGETEVDLKILETFSTETGGEMFAVRDPDDLKEASARIVEELRYQYVIGYHPKRDVWDGSFRRVRLEARRRGLDVRTRMGYYATP